MRRTLSIMALSMTLFQGAQAGSIDTPVSDEPFTAVIHSKANITFPTVTKAGKTKASTSTLTGVSLPAGFVLWETTNPPHSFYDLTTTAEYTTPVTVCMYYNASLE